MEIRGQIVPRKTFVTVCVDQRKRELRLSFHSDLREFVSLQGWQFGRGFVSHGTKGTFSDVEELTYLILCAFLYGNHICCPVNRPEGK